MISDKLNFYGIIILISIIIIGIIANRFKHPFKYPYIKYKIDISGKRQPSYEECIDEWIICNKTIDILDLFNDMLQNWDENAKEYLNKTWFWKKHKTDLYTQMKHEIIQKNYKSFKFIFTRIQTRYKQINYQKHPYKVQNIEHTKHMTLSDMLYINNILKDINYETTRQKYFAKNQRKLMTKELRKSIIERDKYTCQICGKHMPDEVGLHVDHIVSIKKGGKTVSSNLQVTCDKCNLRKSSKQ